MLRALWYAKGKSVFRFFQQVVFLSIVSLWVPYCLGEAALQNTQPVELIPDADMQKVDAGLSFLVLDVSTDQQGEVEDVLSRLQARQWATLKGDINLGYDVRPHWFRLQVNNSGDVAQQRLLELEYPLLDRIDLYVLDADNVVASYLMGDSKPFAERPIKHRNFVVPLTVPPRESRTIYFRVKTSGALQAPLTLWKQDAFYSASEKNLALKSVFYGMLLVMAVFNLLLYFSLREKAYLFYVFFVSTILVLASGMHGTTFQFIYPQFPTVHSAVILIFVPLSQIAICYFTIEFLSLKSVSRMALRVFQGFAVLACMGIVGALFLPYSTISLFSVIVSIPISMSSFIAGVILWRKGDRSAKLFSVAWFAFLAGVTESILNKLGFVPTTVFTEYGIPVTTTAQVVLFSFALADRFNVERDARLKAQEEGNRSMQRHREAEAQLVRAVSHHEISGLPNRLLFERAILPAISNPPLGRDILGVVLLHLRRFDDVNKTLGHRNADILLRRIGDKVNAVAGQSSSAIVIEQGESGPVHAAHIEGVSFGFALGAQSHGEAIKEIERLTKNMSIPIEFLGLSLEVSFLVGCSFSEGKNSDPQTLLRQAFIAFDQADVKLSPIAIYESTMNPYSPRRLTLMTELRAALEEDLLELHFQPQIHLASKRVCGFEALIRWVHPEYGFVPPDEFIPMAENTGLMKPLTQWVISRAVSFIQQLDDNGCDANVAVNISALNLRESTFCEQVCDILVTSKIPHRRLILEVTETAAMVDPVSAMSVLEELQKADVGLSIDDFGTGHSSLSYIRKLPVHEIKIDRSFVMDMDSNTGDETIVKTMINMCHDLGYLVVAEGVENQDIIDLLAGLNCDIVQGYHISRPLAQAAILDWLHNSGWALSASPVGLEISPVPLGIDDGSVPGATFVEPAARNS